MRNPLGTGALTTEDKQFLDKLSEYFTDKYREDIKSICINTFGSTQLYAVVAAFIAAGYALKMYEMENLEEDFLKKVNNAN